MKVIIDIPEDIYTRLFDNGIQDNEIAVDDVCEMARALRLGIPLPKNHGRLIDADELYNSLEFPTQQFASAFKQVLDDAPTIIEAEEEK